MTTEPDDLDREIDALLGVEPSPQFLAAVRTRIAQERRPRWFALLLGGSAVAAAAVLAVALHLDRGDAGRPAVAPDVAAPPPAASALVTAAESAPARIPEGAPVSPAATHDTAGAARRRSPHVGAEVLVPRAERESLQRVLRTAAREPLRLPRRESDVVHYPAESPPPLVVPALVIEPLVPEDPAEGDLR